MSDRIEKVPDCFCKAHIHGGHHTPYGCHSDGVGPVGESCVHCRWMKEYAEITPAQDAALRKAINPSGIRFPDTTGEFLSQRDAALEEAAVRCLEVGDIYSGLAQRSNLEIAEACANAIRALKGPRT